MRTTFRMEDEYITMVRGDTMSFGIEAEDGDGNPITFDTVFFTCKKTYADTTPIFQKSLEDGIEEIEAGKYAVRVAPADTVNLEADRYVYDLQLALNGDVFTFKRGILDIEADVTR